MKKFVAVAGNIGVGKSTLVALLCQQLGWQPFYEPAAENPYLADFYNNMHAWAFHSQVFFLSRRLHAQRQMIEHPTSVLQDRSIYEDAEIFARNLHDQGLMNARDYRTYRALYEVMVDFLPPPDLVIYLRARPATLVQRIGRRGREYERTISPAYLDQINECYETWVCNFTLCPILTVPADDLDFVANPSHLELIVAKVQEKLTGKEEVSFGPGEVARLKGHR
ncbi:MAG: deoxynucleoside kinase [Chloroflexota bacterium]